MARREPMLGRPSFLKTFVATLATIAALFLIDTFLANTERAETRLQAARFYETGKRLLDQGRGGRINSGN